MCASRDFSDVYMYIAFNILRRFCWGQHKIEKMHFFQQFKDRNSGREHENYANDPILIYFLSSTASTSEFENI